jgi:hypothetical protein
MRIIISGTARYLISDTFAIQTRVRGNKIADSLSLIFNNSLAGKKNINDSLIGTGSYATIGRLYKVADSLMIIQQADWNQATTTAPSYIKNKPTLGTAASKNVPISGNAGAGEVVLGNDSRLGGSGTDTVTQAADGLRITRSGNTVTVRADSMARKLMPGERVLYNANTWVSGDLGTTFTYTGTIGTDVSIVGGKIQMINGNQTIGATTNAAFNRVLKLASYGGTLLPRVKIVTKFKVSGTLSSSTSGLAAGQYSINALASLSNMMGYFNTTTTGTGTASLILGTANTNAATSSTSIAYTSADYLIAILERDYDKVYLSVRDATTDSAIVQCMYQWDGTNSSNTITPNFPNTGVFGWANLGGTVTIDSIAITTTTPYNPPVLAITDSKGWYTGPNYASIGSQLQSRLPGLVLSAGPTDGIRDVMQRLREIDTVIRPQQVLMVSIPRNDAGFGVASTIWKPNCISADSAFKANGAKVIWTDGVFENTYNHAAVWPFIDSAFYPNVIRTWKVGNIAANVSLDNIHPSILGSQNFVRTVLASSKLQDLGQRINTTYSPDDRLTPYYDSLKIYGGIDMAFGTYRPAVSGVGNFFLREGGLIAAAFGSSAQFNTINVCAASNAAIVLTNNTGGNVATAPALQVRAATVTGSPTEVFKIWEDGIYGSLSTRMVHPAAKSMTIPFGAGVWSTTSLTDSTEGGYIPYTGSGNSEFILYGRQGGSYIWRQSPTSLQNTVRQTMRLFNNNDWVLRDSVDKGVTAWINGAVAINKDSVSRSSAGSTEMLLLDTVDNKIKRFTVPSGGGTNYQTVQVNSSSAAQRGKLNFSSQFTATDNSGNGSTDISLTSVTTQSPGDNTTKPASTAYVDAAVAGISSGKFLSATTNVTNITSSTVDSIVYTKTGNAVTLKISGTVNATAAAYGSFEVTIPFSNTTWSSGPYCGTGAAYDITAGGHYPAIAFFSSDTKIKITATYANTNTHLYTVIAMYDTQ